MIWGRLFVRVLGKDTPRSNCRHRHCAQYAGSARGPTSAAVTALTRRPGWVFLLILALLGACSSSSSGGDSNPPSGGGWLAVDPSGTITVAGPPGGPFSPGSQDLTLSNVGNSPLGWSAVASANWLSLSAASGQLDSGETTVLTVLVDQALAGALPEGVYQGTVSVANTDNPPNQIDIAVVLDVGENWSVDPYSTFHTSGPAGGPFNPSQRTYTVRNDFNAILSWTVVSSAAWVTTDVSSGIIAPGDSVLVVATINQGLAAGLANGTHDATLTFSADQGAANIDRSVRLTAGNGGLTAVISTPPNTMKIAPYSTMFSGLDSVEDSQPIVRWEWDFGDETSADPRTDEGMLVGHRFDQAGTYTITLTVIDASGASSTSSMATTVDPFTGTTYYVSQSSGSNANDGLSPGSPWQTLGYAIGNMGGSKNQPNKLLLKRGDVWTQSSTLSTVGPSILGAYASGAKPEIRFPGTDDHLSLGTNQEWGLSRIVSDLHITNPSGPRISTTIVSSMSSGNTIRRCDLINGGMIASTAPSAHINLLVLEDTTCSSSKKLGLYAQYHSWLSVRRCRFTDSGSDMVLDHQMYIHVVEKVLWEDCYHDGGAGTGNFGMKQNSVVDGLFRRCEITNTRNGINLGTNFTDSAQPSNTNVINEDHKLHHIGRSNQGSAFFLLRVKSVTIRNCEMYAIQTSPSWGIAAINFANDDPGATVRILNNTFYSNDVPDIRVGGGLVYDLIEIKNNIFARSGTPSADHSFFQISQMGLIPSIDSDYNCFWWPGQNTGNAMFAIGSGVPSHSYDAWKTDFSKDAQSFWFNPLFADPSNWEFSLNVSSPAIDVGSSLARVHDDIDGNPRPTGAGHDLGAHER